MTYLARDLGGSTENFLLACQAAQHKPQTTSCVTHCNALNSAPMQCADCLITVHVFTFAFSQFF